MLSAVTKTKLLIATGCTVAALAVSAVPQATAAGSNPWKKIGTVHDNFNQPGLTAGADGSLHAVWVRNPTNSTQDVVHTSVSLGGTIGANTDVVTGWPEIWPVPDLVSTANGLQAFWGGTRSLQANETNKDLSTATAPANGAPWTLQSGDIETGAGGAASAIGAALGASGVPLVSWESGSSGVFVHAGTDPSTANYNVQAQLGGCCGYTPDIGYDASSGDAWVVWASNATDHVGLYAQKLNATTGEPIGSATRLPQSATTYASTVSFDQQITRTPVVTGKHAAYVAYTASYPTTTRILLWKLSSAGVSAPIVVTKDADGVRTPGIAVDSNGRVWVTWSHRGPNGLPVVQARRSNPAVTRFGAAVAVSKPPSGDCQSLYELTPAAASSRLHIVATWAASCSSSYGLYYAQVFPGLSLSASPSHFRGKSKVTFTVTDAGVAVKGATVSVDGKTGTTDSKGEASIVLGPVNKKARFVATATRKSFVRGRTTVIVRPK
jgi:hypothetical protein